MPGAEEEVGAAIPYRHDNFVAGVEGGEGIVEQAGEAEIANADGAGRGDHYVGGFEVAVHDPVAVEVEEAVEELEEDRFDHG